MTCRSLSLYLTSKHLSFVALLPLLICLGCGHVEQVDDNGGGNAPDSSTLPPGIGAPSVGGLPPGSGSVQTTKNGGQGATVESNARNKKFNPTGSAELDIELRRLRAGYGGHISELMRQNLVQYEEKALFMRRDTGHWPKTLDELHTTERPRYGKPYLAFDNKFHYFENGKCLDYWGTEIRFEFTDRVLAFSNGPDLKPNTADDVRSTYYDDPKKEEILKSLE